MPNHLTSERKFEAFIIITFASFLKREFLNYFQASPSLSVVVRESIIEWLQKIHSFVPASLSRPHTEQICIFLSRTIGWGTMLFCLTVKQGLFCVYILQCILLLFMLNGAYDALFSIDSQNSILVLNLSKNSVILQHHSCYKAQEN